MACPVHYGLCRQTVTVYHQGEAKVYERAFLEFRHKLRRDRLGEEKTVSFLLVIPGEQQAVFPGDLVAPGRGGPEAAFPAAWAEVKYWDGKAVHTEAGA